jgi:hypothetical protein
MKRFEVFYLFFTCILLFNNSFTEADQQINVTAIDNFPNRTKVNFQPDSTNKIVLIYDYDAASAKLQYRPVKIQNPTGNYLKDVLKVFIDYNHFLEPTDSIRFEKMERKEDFTILYFSGLKKSKIQKDKNVFFKKALELTIARNFQGKHFKIVLNEDYP